MKKILLYISIFSLFSCIAPIAFAVSPTPSKSIPSQAVTTQIEEQINNLKDKIASRVAQLNLVQKKGIVGTVTDTSETQITLKDAAGNIHFIDVDELTKFSSSSNKNFGMSDITKNSTLGVLGLYNKDSRRILARFITVLILPQYIRGAIAGVDKTNFTITVVKNDATQITIEVEDITKMTSYTSSAGSTKSGFSKIQTGERVYVVGYKDTQNLKQLIASRIILFPSLPINPAIGTLLPATPTNTPIPSPTPTGINK